MLTYSICSNSALYLGCPEENMNLGGIEGGVWTQNIQSWNACSELCSKTRHCQNWIWHHGDSGKWSHQCVTVTDYKSTRRDTNTISGRVGCQEKKM